MILKQTGLPPEYRDNLHLAFYEGRFLKRRGDDCYSVSGNGTRSGKVLMIYALIAEDGDDALDILAEAENMVLARQWMIQQTERTNTNTKDGHDGSLLRHRLQQTTKQH